MSKANKFSEQLKECRGCKTYRNSWGSCMVTKYREHCPCVNCIVKVTCKLRCEDYSCFVVKAVEELDFMKNWMGRKNDTM
jgi:hypothetical protein